MLQSITINNLAAAFVKFQASLKAAKKGTVNPYFHSKYTDLATVIEAVREDLAKNGLAFTQIPSGNNQLTTLLIHESGEYLGDTFEMHPVDGKPQSVGSALTYQRRYSLGAVLGLATEEDDDGNAASGTKAVQAKSKPSKAIPLAGAFDLSAEPWETVKPKPAVDPVYLEKVKIQKLVTNLGHLPRGEEGWKETVLEMTGLELIPENYKEIIKKLEV